MFESELVEFIARKPATVFLFFASFSYLLLRLADVYLAFDDNPRV